MSEQLNAVCSICNNRYHVCNTCKSIQTLKTWRTVADTIDCYKIYMLIHDYKNGTLTKEDTHRKLAECTLPQTFQPHIKAVVDEIMNHDCER